MIDAHDYLEHIRRDGARIAQIADGHLEEPVPSCPGNTVASLLLHAGGLCMYFAQRVMDDTVREPDFSAFGNDVLVAFRREHADLLRALSSRDPEAPATTWGVDQHVRFFYRRTAQELAVHRWDFEDALDEATPIEPVLAGDGIQEMLEEFIGVRAAELFAGNGETFCFEPTDLARSWTFAMHPDVIDVRQESVAADVTARSSASDLLLFMWGRVPPERLEASGDAALLKRWSESVKI